MQGLPGQAVAGRDVRPLTCEAGAPGTAGCPGSQAPSSPLRPLCLPHRLASPSPGTAPAPSTPGRSASSSWATRTLLSPPRHLSPPSPVPGIQRVPDRQSGLQGALRGQQWGPPPGRPPSPALTPAAPAHGRPTVHCAFPCNQTPSIADRAPLDSSPLLPQLQEEPARRWASPSWVLTCLPGPEPGALRPAGPAERPRAGRR